MTIENVEPNLSSIEPWKHKSFIKKNESTAWKQKLIKKILKNALERDKCTDNSHSLFNIGKYV